MCIRDRYLKGLINFTPASAFMSNITGQDPAERDPKGLRASYDAFNDLIKRYPDSKYTPDAIKRVAWLVNTIAMNEVHVARYYYERGAYIAAANRCLLYTSGRFKGAVWLERQGEGRQFVRLRGRHAGQASQADQQRGDDAGQAPQDQ